METLVGVHSLWRWVVLLVLLVAMVRGLIGWLRGGPWTDLDRQLTLAAVTVVDIQLLLGVIVWIGRRHWEVPSTFRSVTHPLVMLLAVAIVHVGSLRLRREESPTAKHRWLALSLLVALFLITAVIPPDSWRRAWAG